MGCELCRCAGWRVSLGLSVRSRSLCLSAAPTSPCVSSWRCVRRAKAPLTHTHSFTHTHFSIAPYCGQAVVMAVPKSCRPPRALVASPRFWIYMCVDGIVSTPAGHAGHHGCHTDLHGRGQETFGPQPLRSLAASTVVHAAAHRCAHCSFAALAPVFVLHRSFDCFDRRGASRPTHPMTLMSARL